MVTMSDSLLVEKKSQWEGLALGMMVGSLIIHSNQMRDRHRQAQARKRRRSARQLEEGVSPTRRVRVTKFAKQDAVC
jgi:hypothetical protein